MKTLRTFSIKKNWNFFLIIAIMTAIFTTRKDKLNLMLSTVISHSFNNFMLDMTAYLFIYYCRHFYLCIYFAWLFVFC